MFKKILIANRGEIACRVIAAAQRLGITAVAVYSDADKDAPHVDLANEAVRIGPAPAAESYLDAGRIIGTCKATGADAVHPGYGFLSEQAEFARALSDNGIVFIGPNPSAIEVMGDKIESKKLAQSAGIPTVPGYAAAIKEMPQAERIADEIGYPVIVKAASGGGGRGMRIVESRNDLAANIARAQSEAQSAFGDSRIFLEKFIPNPRHIEIQVLGDKHGNLIHLGERECSIQRRHQKVIEESPSPFLSSETREKLGEQAVSLAQAVRYDSAGTVEFIAAPDGCFYFLEMNTRLQVEHPVTELVTGLDLVEWMIRIATGEPLHFSQTDLSFKGWAIETRILAEDPERGFLPSTGRITLYRPPVSSKQDKITVRIDSGICEGSEIPVYYDPLMAKLITHAPGRKEAIQAQACALDSFAIEGVATNIAFLAAVMAHERFQSGALSTDFIDKEFPHGYAPILPRGRTARLFACVAAAADHVMDKRRCAISGQLAAPAPVRLAKRRAILIAGVRYDVRIEENGDAACVTFDSDGQTHVCLSGWTPGTPVWEGTVNGKQIAMRLRPIRNGFALSHGGAAAEARIHTLHAADLAALMPEKKSTSSAKLLRAPMPALLKSIAVTAGQAVQRGEALCVIEAMKMETVLHAEFDGTIAAINARPGDTLSVDAVIMTFSAGNR
ncbi:MAG TPA: acetyl/propionyl/methylcrotonyl-CoA carboxylase subunit alpha [Methylocella sp.]|nr:acetyl/propionyl/methylcrotonyl-CoA carboxylase subunit alpha [Methylocella sp.]